MSYTTSVRPAPGRRRRPVDGASIGMLLAFLAIAVGVAGFGTIVTIGAVGGWYASAPHVAWTPPNWAFGVVWSVLYLLIAVSGWLVWLRRYRRGVRAAMTLFVVQFVLNALWTPIFFGGYTLIGGAALWIAVGVIVLLDLAVGTTIATFWSISKPAALLLVPYFLWILYASTLNWGDAVLNALS